MRQARTVADVDAELRLIAAVRQVAAEHGAVSEAAADER